MAKDGTVKIGLFGIGLDTYWPQFDGLRDKLKHYQKQIVGHIQIMGAEVADAGMVDNPEKAVSAASFLKTQDVEIVFVYISTYALSSTVLPVIQQVNKPVILLNIQPVSAIDYDRFNALGDRGIMTGQWLAHCQACSLPEIACVLNRAGKKYYMVTGYMQEDSVWEDIRGWIDAARVKKHMRDNRVGILGHYYCGMLDVYSDLTRQSCIFGSHFEILEMCQLLKLRQSVTQQQIADKLNEFNEVFDISNQCDHNEIVRAAHTSCALDELVRINNLGSMAYYYEGVQGNDYENIVTSVIAGNSILTSKHVPIAGECEVKNVQAMKIMDLFGAGGSFSEFYAMDFDEDIVLLGHDGPAHFMIAEGRVKLVPLPVYHGKPGKGISIQMTVRHGPVTLLSVVQGREDSIFLLVAEGHSVPGPTLQIGNTNSRYKFKLNVKEFVETWSLSGPAHHCAIGVGHIADNIAKLAQLLDIECRKIC